MELPAPLGPAPVAADHGDGGDGDGGPGGPAARPLNILVTEIVTILQGVHKKVSFCFWILFVLLGLLDKVRHQTSFIS